MTSTPPRTPRRTIYHRSLGWHAPALRRAVLVAAFGLIAGLLLSRFIPWELAVVCGWDLAALVLLGTVWPIIIGSDGSTTQHLASREDETRGSAALLLLNAALASLLGVAFALSLAGQQSGAARAGLVAIALLTVLISWTLVNTVYVLHYAHLYYAAPRARVVEFPELEPARRPGVGRDSRGVASVADALLPTYRDFAYLAFTIGMTYQVSDTNLRAPTMRRSVLAHALLAYVFGVVIVAGAINLIAGLVR